MRRLEGIFAPTVTTFTDDEALDLDAFQENVGEHLADGLNGVVLAGSTGEAALLSDAERVAITAAAREIVPKDKWLIVGCGSESTRQTVQRTVQAKEAGADAALVVSPHYYTPAMTDRALRAHFTRVADTSPLPIILYNIPKYAHFALSESLVADLAKHPNVIGIKDSSGAHEMIQGYLRAQGDAFSVITGSGSGLQAHLGFGARGGILGVATFAAGFALEVFGAVAANDIPRATAAQARLTPMANVIVGKQGVAGVKAAMDQVGRRGGRPRMPLLPLTADEKAEMVAALGAR
jgi:4-hydroxy-2-oxoglutarate aldolase